MDISVDSAFLVTVLLISIRMSAVFLLSPLFAVAQVPLQFRILFLLSLSALMLMGLQVSPVTVPASFSGLLVAAVSELMIGGLLAFGVFAAFGAFVFGGRILDFQMGFGVANLIDPATNAQSPLIGTMLNMMAVMAFFMVNGHHMLIRGLAYTLEKIPVGSAFTQFNVEAVVAQFGLMFVYGLAIVAPPIMALLLLDIGMAVAARTMPQVNMFIVGIPLKIFIGLMVLAGSINYMPPLLEKIYASIFLYWESVLE